MLVLMVCSYTQLNAESVQARPGIDIRIEPAFRTGDTADWGLAGEQVRLTERAAELSELEIRSEPDGADVFIDGRFVGRTPVLLRDPGAGRRVLLVSREGYRELRYELSLSEGVATTLEFRLRRRSGYLVLEAPIPHSDGPPPLFLLNGEPLRGGMHELPAATYRLSVRRFGYLEQSTVLEVRPDMATVVKAHMEPAPFEITALQAATRRFNPGDVGRLGEVPLRVEASAPGEFILEIHNYSGTTVWSSGVTRATSYITELTWNGQDSAGRQVQDGVYTAVLVAAEQGRTFAVPVVVDTRFRTRMRSPFSVQAGTALVPGLSLLGPGRVQFSGALGYHAGAFSAGSPEYYPAVMQARAGLPARLEFGALVGGQFYNNPEFHRYYAALGLTHRTISAELGPFEGILGFSLRGSYADDTQDSMALRPDPFGAYRGLALSVPLQFGFGAVGLRIAPEIAGVYPSPAYRDRDTMEYQLFWAGRLALELDMGYLAGSLSWVARTRLGSDPLVRRLPDTALAELQLLLPGTVLFLHGSLGLDYLPGSYVSGFGSLGLGVLY